jgi:hypothetical protein
MRSTKRMKATGREAERLIDGGGVSGSSKEQGYRQLQAGGANPGAVEGPMDQQYHRVSDPTYHRPRPASYRDPNAAYHFT